MLDQPQFVTQCETDDEGNLILNFPEELLEAMGWKEGTTLDIGVLPGTIVLREVKEKGVGDS
jgi:bifunctional DNA-binding transcriptional regulator/antitoxin component of YhaV-PrlF toxin-antitoxin module